MIELGLNYHIKLKNLIKNSLKVKLIVIIDLNQKEYFYIL